MEHRVRNIGWVTLMGAVDEFWKRHWMVEQGKGALSGEYLLKALDREPGSYHRI